MYMLLVNASTLHCELQYVTFLDADRDVQIVIIFCSLMHPPEIKMGAIQPIE